MFFMYRDLPGRLVSADAKSKAARLHYPESLQSHPNPPFLVSASAKPPTRARLTTQRADATARCTLLLRWAFAALQRMLPRMRRRFRTRSVPTRLVPRRERTAPQKGPLFSRRRREGTHPRQCPITQRRATLLPVTALFRLKAMCELPGRPHAPDACGIAGARQNSRRCVAEIRGCTFPCCMQLRAPFLARLHQLGTGTRTVASAGPD